MCVVFQRYARIGETVTNTVASFKIFCFSSLLTLFEESVNEHR